jgi:hypothetical protein
MTNRKFIREVKKVIDRHLNEQSIDKDELYTLQSELRAFIELIEEDETDGFS